MKKGLERSNFYQERFFKRCDGTIRTENFKHHSCEIFVKVQLNYLHC